MENIKILKKLAHINVLIVEDDEMTACALKQSLSVHCKCVEVAVDGLQGFEMFEKNRPDVVISDINLPKLNGLKMISLMREISPHLPVIIMTSYDSNENISESINQDVYSYLRKPISIEQLQITLLMATKDIVKPYIALKNNFIYCKQDKNILGPDNKEIVLTKFESDLIYLLISNIDHIIEYATIENYVWQDKSMSREALRMQIKKIRKKTYPEIIENISGCGYRINSTK